jgi:hypothetical protein
LPPAIQRWSPTSLQHRLFKTGGRLIRHARYFTLVARRKLLDRASTPADPRAHRATRVAPDVIESDGPWWEHAWPRGASISEAGRRRREARETCANQQRWCRENGPGHRSRMARRAS